MKLVIGIVLLCLSTYCHCKSLDTRIVGGSFASENQFPYQIALLRNGRLSCGGSIFNDKWIITAAHCVPNGYLGLSVMAGSNSLKNGGIKRNVNLAIPHEKYNPRECTNDIALIRLEEPLEFSDAIKAIPLRVKDAPVGSNVTISGWGRVSTGGAIPYDLKFNILQTIDQPKCEILTGVSSRGLICLGHSRNNGACNGDSGGSAAYENELIGVANFVVSGCGSSNPDGYASIPFFVDWINETVKKHDKV
ncbi:unnamed protein product [Diamesa tonsa]